MLLIDKPKGMTSHDVVDVVRRATGERRVGHAGTLDPNATGLLIVGVGREETRKLEELTRNTKKTYVADIYLGEERDTDDIEGKVVSTSEVKPDLEEVKKVMLEFVGEQEQTPPQYSAVKVGGKKAYELARGGKEVKIKPKKITIYKADILSYKYPTLKVEFEVSSGTYIRSIAHDLGRKLGSFGYLKDLRRTKIGEFSVDTAKSLEEIKQLQQ
ncbi:MAG TPA: tRNA pseudouridine(55) synthase TruB [Patescibacteria group bacterium]